MENIDKNVYELGYLLIPIIPVDKLPEEVSALRNAIESNGGMVLNEETPKQRKLAYEIAHNLTGGKKTRYEDAYFGWMRYQMPPEETKKMEEEVKKSASILRYIVINLSKENKNILKDGNKVKTAGGKKPRKAVSEKEIDKEIDDLLAKDSTITA